MQNKLEEHGIENNSKDFVEGEFSHFRKFFSERELAILRSLDTIQSADSKFLHFTLKFLYKDDLSHLERKTTTGNAESEAITPSKMAILKNIFEERIDGIAIDDENKLSRKKRFTPVLSKVINYIRTHVLKKPRLPRLQNRS